MLGTPSKLLFCILLCLVITVPSISNGEDTATDFQYSSFEWPSYDNRRFGEDYSPLATFDSIPERDFWDEFKYIPLFWDWWISVGGQARVRLEGFHHFNFAIPAAQRDYLYVLQRYMLHAEVNFSDALRLFVQGKSAIVTDRTLVGGRRTVDMDTLALQQAFLEFTMPIDEGMDIYARGGRQDLLYGVERLISPLDWANSRRTFDGGLIGVRGENWYVDGWWVLPVVVQKYSFNEPNEDEDFFGIYGTFEDVFESEFRAEVYFLGQNITMPVMPTSTERYTVGGRVAGPIFENIEMDLEGAGQFGDLGTLDIGAWFVASEVKIFLPDLPMSPWVALGYDYASGDHDPTDLNSGTFNQLYPLGHEYLGYIDIVGRQNIIDYRVSGLVNPLGNLWFKFDGHGFFRSERQDALYNSAGVVVIPGFPGSDKWVGIELDISAKLTFDHHFYMYGGYSHFWAGDFVGESGPDFDIDFWYAQFKYTF